MLNQNLKISVPKITITKFLVKQSLINFIGAKFCYPYRYYEKQSCLYQVALLSP